MGRRNIIYRKRKAYEQDVSKPKNNMVYCSVIKRQKQLFETEKKALTFLKFNQDNIPHKEGTEFRVYYCECCGGYHFTHEKLGHQDERARAFISGTIEAVNKNIGSSKFYRRDQNQKVKNYIRDIGSERFEKIEPIIERLGNDSVQMIIPEDIERKKYFQDLVLQIINCKKKRKISWQEAMEIILKNN